MGHEVREGELDTLIAVPDSPGNTSKPPPGKLIDDALTDYLMTIFSFYIPSVIITLGVVGNTLTFITMTQSIRQKRNVLMSYHFRALAVGDQLMLVFVVFQRWLLSRYPDAMDMYGWFICKEFLYLCFVFFGISVWNVIIISIDRFVAVCYPLQASQWCTIKRATYCYIFNYVFHSLFSLIKLWKEYRIGDYTTHTSVCMAPANFPPWWDHFEVIIYEAIVNYTSPLIVLILNLFILHRFRQQAKEMASLGETGRLKQQETQEKSLTVMMMFVAFTFIFLMAYYPIENILWDFIIPHIKEEHPRLRELSFYIYYYLTTSNQCLNFYLYCLVSPGFRRDVRRLTGCSKTENGH
jgi:hypothetical protein